MGGAEIARTEEIKQGRVPLHTFRMDIDYANVFALTVYGKIGIKVWICKGEVLAKRDLNPNFVGGKSEVSDRRERRDDRQETMTDVMTEEAVVTEEVVVAAVEEVAAEEEVEEEVSRRLGINMKIAAMANSNQSRI